MDGLLVNVAIHHKPLCTGTGFRLTSREGERSSRPVFEPDELDLTSAQTINQPAECGINALQRKPEENFLNRALWPQVCMAAVARALSRTAWFVASA